MTSVFSLGIISFIVHVYVSIDVVHACLLLDMYFYSCVAYWLIAKAGAVRQAGGRQGKLNVC